MILNLISLATVKAQLGITAATYDTPLTALIPVVSADIRRILNTQYDKYYVCAFTSASTSIDLALYTKRRYEGYSGFGESEINVGDVVYNANLPADTYIQAFDPVTGLFTLSATPTGTGTYIYPTVNISQWPTIAAMIWYKYTQQNTNKVDDRSITSIGAGPTSISYSDKEINNKWRYPQRLISDLGTPFASIK